jgi:hypothetical protein
MHKILSAIIKSWPLEFHDIKMNIDAQFKRLREQASVAHQAETREMHVKLSEIQHLFIHQSCSISQAFGEKSTTPTLSGK